MKLFFILVIFSTLIACEPSEEEAKEKPVEKNETGIAATTCSILKQTRQRESAIRLEKLNEARQKLGAPLFLDGDDVIKQSLEFGTCELLVKDSESYESVTLSVMSAYREKERMAKVEWVREARKERRAEAKRVEEAQRAARRISDRQRTSS